MIVEIATIGGVIGAFMVAKGRALTANIVWAIANAFMLTHLYIISEYEIFGMYIVYQLLALYGIYNLTR